MPSQPARRRARPPGFDRLFAEGRQAVRTGTHQAECTPADGGSRWAVGAVLRPDAQAARTIEQVARAAAAVVGANHWLAGATRSSHLTLRRHLEPSRRRVSPGDRNRTADDTIARGKMSALVKLAIVRQKDLRDDPHEGALVDNDAAVIEMPL